MIILGLHKDPWHNTGASIIVNSGNGPQYVMISEERLDRKKDSRAFPERAVAACMREFGIKDYSSFDCVVLDYICEPDWKNDQFRTPCKKGTFLEKIDPKKIHVINHHLAHAASAFYSSAFSEAAILVIDGRGSQGETQSLFVGDASGLHLIESTSAIGIGLMYAAVTQAIGFGNLQEGKTMGLAPYGGGLSQHFFNFSGQYEGINTDYSYFCVENEYKIKMPHPPIVSFDDKAKAAFEAQIECEKALLHLATHARKVTGKRFLCISGGVGLNSVANYEILKANIFEDIFINPACSDTGIPLGAALYGYHSICGMSQTGNEISPYIGPSYSSEEMKTAALAAEGCVVIYENVFEKAASLLADNKILGCIQGRSEMGPRALGNRSIIMSPLDPGNKDTLNSRVKHREHFRPFAPAVLEEYTSEYFDLDVPSPYMLLVPQVKAEKKDVIPAVTHVDGSGRLQTLTKERNGVFRLLTEAFYKRTGVPVLLNTSFNVNGEPIVETPMDAVRCFMGTNIDALLLGDILVMKNK